MNLSERNRKVAIARWNRVHTSQKNKILKDNKSLLIKAAICGFLAGDGSVQKRKEKGFYHYQIDFFPDDEIMMHTYLNYIKTVYNMVPTVRKDKNFYNVRISSKVLFDDLNELALFGIRKWTLPKSLFKIKGAKENWLRAFFSAEAYVGEKSIKIQTINREGMKEVSRILKESGIDNNYYEYTPRKNNESSVGIVFIAKKESRKRFYEIIGFWHNKKNSRLRKSLDL